MLMDELQSLSYRELQAACKEAGLPAVGKKAVLLQRLANNQDHIQTAVDEEDELAYEYDDAELLLKAVASLDDEFNSEKENAVHIRPRPYNRACELICYVMLLFTVVGVLDSLVAGGTTYNAVACSEIASTTGSAESGPTGPTGSTDRQQCTGIKRLGFHQGKTEAKWLYFFIAHVYDAVLNPWHWTTAMRDTALNGVDGNLFDLKSGLRVCDVGAGTGFTSIGVLNAGVRPNDLSMLDQSPQQRSKAVVKPELSGVREYIMGDAEGLPANWTSTFDRYVSAGSIEYWPHPQRAILEAHRVLKVNGKAMIIGPTRATNAISRFMSDLWYLFPTDAEYRTWFERAGFVDVAVVPILPEWYRPQDRAHGLIMGSVVVGTKKANAKTIGASASNVKTPEDTSTSSTTSTRSNVEDVYEALITVPRFVVGNVGGVYYAVVPFAIWLKNAYCWDSWIVIFLAILIPTIMFIHHHVLPTSWQPYVAGPALYNGIANLYNSSSAGVSVFFVVVVRYCC
jgi:MPBQ/MSBQ methyltransferase